MEPLISYTITSKNPHEYNAIRTNLQPPISQMCKLTLTNLTTKACFVILEPSDFIEIDNRKFFFNDSYSDLSLIGFATILNEILNELNINVNLDLTGRLEFTSLKPFSITSMSYNVLLLSGFYDMSLPTESNTNIKALSVGLTLSTPVLYIVSNLGAKCYDNKEYNYCDRKVLMRINNSFTANYPIINSNVEFSSFLPVNSLSNIEFRLVDANLHDIKLLAPMYLSATVESIQTDDELTNDKPST